LALALLAGFDGSAPVATGAYAFVDEDGVLSGDLTGGAIEAAVADVARQMGPASIQAFPISDDRAQQCGLSCGGVAHVLIAPIADRTPFEQAQTAVQERRAHALAHRLDGSGTTYIDADTPGDDAVTTTARELLANGRDAERRLEEIHL